MDEIVPNAALPSCPLGLLNCGVFSTLNTSIRNSEETGPILVFLMIDASIFLSPGPRMLFRDVLPKVPVVSGTCWKHDMLNHWVIVGLARTGSQIVFVPVFQMPVESMVCDCVMLTGIPDRRYRMPLTCQPPHMRC